MSSNVAGIDVATRDRLLRLDKSEAQGSGERYVREEKEEGLEGIGNATSRALV